jgi:tetratricopeptide (TPR) repeat protein
MVGRIHVMSKKIYLIPVLSAILLMTGLSRAEDAGGQNYFKGVEYAAQGRFEEAKQEYQKALADEAYYAASRLEIHAIDDVLNQKANKETALLVFEGKKYAVNQKWQEAIDLYTKAIKQDPRYAYAFISRGIAYASIGELDRAISNFSDALKVDLKYTEVYNNRGVALMYLGRYNKAVEDLTKAIECDPAFAQLYYNRGLAYSYKGRHDMAIPDFEKAVELKPDYSRAYLGKAISCEKSDRKEEAIDAYKKVLQYDKSKDPEMLEFVNESIKKLEAPPAEPGK